MNMLKGNFGKPITKKQEIALSKMIVEISLKLPFPKIEELCNCGLYDCVHMITENCNHYKVSDEAYRYTKTQMNPDDDKSRIEFVRSSVHNKTGVWI